MATQTRTTWRIAGEEVGACNCSWGCPCQFNALPTLGRCEGFGAFEIHEGYFGSTRLDGVRFAGFYSWPGPIHEGNGTRRMIFDERATPGQRTALEELESAAHGGGYFEVFSLMCPNRLDPLVAPIELSVDRPARLATVRISGIVDSKIEPIRNPVTREEHRVRIVMPGGFEFEEAEVANSVYLRSTAGKTLDFELANTYGQLNEFDWSSG